MAQVSFDVASEMEASRPQGQQGAFNFFTLRNDGDEAIVRFRYDNTSQFQIFTVHDVPIVTNGRETQRKVSCLRNPKDPIDMCPLCKSGKSSRNTFLIEMIQYVTDPNTNTVVANPVVWERSMTYANRLKSLIDEYGPLSDCVFKIKRCGAAGSRDTTYEIYYGNPKMYPDEIFVKDFSAFENVRFLGTVIMNKNYDEITQYLTTGSFPQTQQAHSSDATQGNYASNAATYNESVQPSTPQYVPKEAPVTQPALQYVPNQQPQPTMAPPARQEYIPNNQPPVRQYEPTTQTGNTPPQRATRYY